MYSHVLRFAIAVLLNDRQFPAAFGSTKHDACIQAANRAFYELSFEAIQSQVKEILIFFQIE